MAGNSDYRKGSKGGRRRNLPPPPLADEGFGSAFGNASRYLKSSEKYNPGQLYEKIGTKPAEVDLDVSEIFLSF